MLLSGGGIPVGGGDGGWEAKDSGGFDLMGVWGLIIEAELVKDGKQLRS